MVPKWISEKEKNISSRVRTALVGAHRDTRLYLGGACNCWAGVELLCGMGSRLLFRAAVLGMAVLAWGAGSVWACSCLPVPSVQDEFARSEVVVHVRLERTVGAKTDAELFAQPAAHHKAMMRVERVFKGDLTAGQPIEIAQGHGSFCGYFFSEEHKGQEYLLYLDASNPETKVFRGPMCGRSGPVSNATADLKYLERRAKLEGKTMLAGVIHNIPAKATGKRGVTVTVRGGDRTYTTRTGEDGYFEVIDLRPGGYSVGVPKTFDYFYFAPLAQRQPRELRQAGARRRSGGRKAGEADANGDISRLIGSGPGDLLGERGLG